MDGRASALLKSTMLRRWAIDLVILAVIGLLMGFIGPFTSEHVPIVGRYIYWLICMIGGGLIGIAADEALGRGVPNLWIRTVLVSVLMTPFVTFHVLWTERLMFDGDGGWYEFQRLFLQVFPILLAVMAVRALVWRRPPARIETRTVIAPPLPEAEAAFRRRLSAKRRGARLIAVEAHDHYLKVHTDAGAELITLRFGDALSELALAHGWRVHRSWWVAADAVQSIRWRRGMGELHLLGDLKAPVSRTYAAILKEAGWS